MKVKQSVFTLLSLLPVLAMTTAVYTNTAIAEDKYATAEELGLMKGFPPPPDKQVTKANAIQNAPYNRWAYQHMRMFFPSADVPAADKPYPLSKTVDWTLEDGVKVMEPGTAKTKRMADYLRSNDYLLPAYGKAIDGFVEAGGERSIAVAMVGVREEYLNAAFEEMEKRYSTIENYFAEALGIDASGQNALRDLYLEK